MIVDMDVSEKYYEYLNNNLNYFNEKIIESFRLYIKLASAIIGGALYVHLTLLEGDPRRLSIKYWPNALLVMVGVSVIIMIINYLILWVRYRKRLDNRLFPDKDIKYGLTVWINEFVMCLIVIIVSVGFWMFNPL